MGGIILTFLKELNKTGKKIPALGIGTWRMVGGSAPIILKMIKP